MMYVKTRGYALLVVLGFAAVLAVFTVSMASRSSASLHTADYRGQSDSASYAAQSGVQASLAKLYDPVSPGAARSPNANQDALNANWFITDRSVLLNESGAGMSSISRAYHNIVGAPGRTEVAPDNTVIPQDFFYIISVGMVGATVNPQTYEIEGGVVREATTMGAMVGSAYPLMPQAIFAEGNLILRQTEVDHFDSRDGTKVRYNGGAATDLMDCDLPEATVVVQNPNTSAIELIDSQIDGHFLFGNATPNIITNFQNQHDQPQAPSVVNPTWRFGIPSLYRYNGPNDTINGHIGSLELQVRENNIALEQLELTSVFPASASPYRSRGGLTLEEGGVYLQEGNLEVRDAGQIVVRDTNQDGEIEDAILLVQGDIVFSGNGIDINMDGQPMNLKIYSLGQNTTFVAQNTNNICALIAGKDMDIRISDSTVWGALLGNNVEINNSNINFDVILQNPTVVANNFNIRILSEGSVRGISVPIEDLVRVDPDPDLPPSLGGDPPLITPGPIGGAMAGDPAGPEPDDEAPTEGAGDQEPTAGEPPAGEQEPTAGRPPAGEQEPTAGEPPAGEQEPTAGEPPTGDQEPSGPTDGGIPAVVDPVEEPLSPIGEEPTKTDPVKELPDIDTPILHDPFDPDKTLPIEDGDSGPKTGGGGGGGGEPEKFKNNEEASVDIRN